MALITSFEQYRDITYEAVEDYNNKDYRQALGKFLDLAETNPSNPKVHEILILTYLKLDMFDKAQQEYEIYCKLVGELMPEMRIPPKKTFDDVAREAGNQLKLEKEHKKIMKKNAKFDVYHSVDTVSRLSIVYMAKGDYSKAEDILLGVKTKIVETCPEDMKHCLTLVSA